ncbi:OsmC family protein [Ferruginibacter sp. HRS2-29]|uniref:OsmC family protein n=1 Tax=Ferruginibacter sp. HRS2-29 TaxID=2487334 RepID=UPI0020CF01E3|nr:OsmC family protein [Ferruginibacter sp. HRS2-29]MCP9751133.1 OsmC family peroxiredoxin [Ferruginibacter sp. HRS2-29]
MVKIALDRVQGDYGFEATDTEGHIVRIDGSEAIGGTGFGVRPMQLLLMGLGGCSAIDIVSILKKQRETVEGFSMHIEGEREPGKEPSLWKNVHIVFTLKGNIDPAKATKACALSMEKYCSVAETLKKGGTLLTWESRVEKIENN